MSSFLPSSATGSSRRARRALELPDAGRAVRRGVDERRLVLALGPGAPVADPTDCGRGQAVLGDRLDPERVDAPARGPAADGLRLVAGEDARLGDAEAPLGVVEQQERDDD